MHVHRVALLLCCVLPAHRCVLTSCSEQCYVRTNVIWDKCYFRWKLIVLSCVLQSSDRWFGHTLAFSSVIANYYDSQCTWDTLAARLHFGLISKLIILCNALMFVPEEGLACLPFYFQIWQKSCFIVEGLARLRGSPR